MMFENGVKGSDGRIHKYACTEIRGDWEWHKTVFDLTSSWKSIKQVCFRCNCTARSPNPKDLYYCLDEDHNWKEFTYNEFVATQMKHSPPCFLFVAQCFF